MNIWHDISDDRIFPTDFISVIEISKGSNMKYELDKETGMLILDRVLYTSTHYPANYGFIPKTLGDDHDPLDVLVLCNEQIQPLTLVRSYPIGVMKMLDGGMGDEKIIAMAYGDPTYNGYTDISELPRHIFDEIQHFFTVYKNLEGKETKVDDIMGIARQHLYGFHIIARDLEADHIPCSFLTFLNQSMPRDDGEDLPFGMMPVLSARDARLAHIHTKLTARLGLDNLNKIATVVLVVLGLENHLLLGQISEISGIQFLGKRTSRNLRDDQGLRLFGKAFQQFHNLTEGHLVGHRAITISAFSRNHFESIELTTVLPSFQGIEHLAHEVVDVEQFQFHTGIVDRVGQVVGNGITKCSDR